MIRPAALAASTSALLSFLLPLRVRPDFCFPALSLFPGDSVYEEKKLLDGNMNCCFKKITPCNGFDVDNPDNAKQNNYAWSMAELGDYIYVGTARDIPYGAIQYYFPEVEVPDVFVPETCRYERGDLAL